MPIIKKVLNSSIVLIDGEGEKDSIVMAKGIGYGRKAGEEVTLGEDSRFFLPVSNIEAKQLIELLDSIPAIYLELAKETVEYAKSMGITLNEHVYVALTDHYHFAVKRYEEHLVSRNRIIWEIKNFYPKEFQVGAYALELLNDRLGIDLPVEEAANIAFHIVNGQKDPDSHTNTMEAAKMIGNVISVVIYSLRTELPEDDMNFTRFKTHVKFLVERVLSNKMLVSENDFMYQQMESVYPEALHYAEKVRTYMLKEYEVAITNEEVAYLTVHIARMMGR